MLPKTDNFEPKPPSYIKQANEKLLIESKETKRSCKSASGMSRSLSKDKNKVCIFSETTTKTYQMDKGAAKLVLGKEWNSVYKKNNDKKNNQLVDKRLNLRFDDVLQWWLRFLCHAVGTM